MKFYNLIGILIFSMIAKVFVSAILIDDFSDQDYGMHKLRTGTDLRIQRGDLGGNEWKFIKQNRLRGDYSSKAHILDYSLMKGDVLNFNDIHMFKFNVCSSASDPAYLGKISLTDTNGTIRDFEDIKFGEMKPNAPFFIDLNTYRHTDKAVGGNTFNFDQIRGINICFNSNNCNFDLLLDSIEAVPEPFSMLTLAGGALGFIRKNRQK